MTLATAISSGCRGRVGEAFLQTLNEADQELFDRLDKELNLVYKNQKEALPMEHSVGEEVDDAEVLRGRQIKTRTASMSKISAIC